MENYEPELMYALDSKGEYADWKNVYNVSGNDVCYCPICLGRVKLWNGQDPNKAYMKQRCFHHIDGMCSQESRIHFAYKNWLLKEHGEFIVNDTTYEIESVEIEKEYNTPFGKYRPDVTIFTKSGKQFFLEIANTNKKTDDYVMKWDKLGYDVLELDVNEQLGTFVLNQLPVLKLIYSAETGVCYIQKYTSSEYSDLITKRKRYWSRQDIINFKIQWEKLDWFWLSLQKFYIGEKNINSVIDSFVKLCPADQNFICSHLKGKKHKFILSELENHYTDCEDKKRIQYKLIDSSVRELNNEFAFSRKCGVPYLCREKDRIMFYKKTSYVLESYCIKANSGESTVKEFFHEMMKKERDTIDSYDNKCKILEEKFLRILNGYTKSFMGNSLWKYSFKLIGYERPHYSIELHLLRNYYRYMTLYYDDICDEKLIKSNLTLLMNDMINDSEHFANYTGVRIMEVRKDGE